MLSVMSVSSRRTPLSLTVRTVGEASKTWRELAYRGFLERVLKSTNVPEAGPNVRAHAERGAAQALVGLRDLLPSYRELCGAAPYYYAAGEVQRLEHQLIEVYSLEELTQMSETIQAQLEGMARAIRTAKGRGVELDG